MSTEEVGDGRIHVVSWMDCLDLRALAVLANSTISNSRLAENVYFHFFLPEGEDEKLSYYKLKVLFPHLNLDIIGQKEVKEKLQTALPEWELLWPSLHELLPFIIPSITPSFSRFIYLSSDVIVKGHIEELFGVDLGPYAIASAEDCTKQLGDYVKIDIVNAIQRTAAKTWVSSEPYDTHACIPDFSVVLVDMKNVDKELVEAIPWWNEVLSLKDERKEVNPAIALALYNRYLKLPSDWKLDATVPPKVDNGSNVLHYDGPIRICSEVSKQRVGSDIGNIWRHYLPPKSDAILDH